MSPSDIKNDLHEKFNVPYSVDFANIAESLVVIDKVVSTLLGLAAWGIAIFITLTTMIDIAYLTFPVLQTKLRTIQEENKMQARLISRAAASAVTEKALNDDGKLLYGIYLMKRLKTYIIAFSILAIILGGFSQIRSLVINIVAAILQGLGV